MKKPFSLNPRDAAELTIKQARFLERYLSNGGNGAEAYRYAYSATAKPQRAAEEALRLLKLPKIARRIDAARAKLQARTAQIAEDYVVSNERIITELAKIGLANIDDYIEIDKDGQPFVDFSEATRDQMAAVAEISNDGEGKVRFKLHDKRQALVDLGRARGMFSDTIKLSGAVAIENLVNASLDEKGKK